MLRIVNQHYKNHHAQLINGDYGTTLDNYKGIATNASYIYGVNGKQIRNLYIAFSKLVDTGETIIGSIFDETVFRHCLSMIGLRDPYVTDYKYVGESDHLQTRMTLSETRNNGSFEILTINVMNDYLDDDGNIVSSSTPITVHHRVDLRRRRFDLLLDNPLHVAYGMIEARKKAEKVVISINSGAFPVRAKESTALHRTAIELFNVVAFFQPGNGISSRHILGKGRSLQAWWDTHAVIIDAMNGASTKPTALVFDFTDIEEFTCSSLVRDKLYLNYSLFPMSRLRPSTYYNNEPDQRYELSERLWFNVLKATREKIMERQKNPEVIVINSSVVLVESLSDVIALEKDFHLPDTVISKKHVTGSLRQYYSDIGGVALTLVCSDVQKIIAGERARSVSLIDVRNGVEVIRCEAVETKLKTIGDAFVIEPITLSESEACNALDAKIFSDRIHGLLKNGKTIVIRKNDGSMFSLHPMLFGQLPYVGGRDQNIDERIRSQMIACFTDVTEVELKPKQGNEIRGYKFLAEPQR